MDMLTNVVSLNSVYIYEISMLYTLNLHSIICQVYLKKARKNILQKLKKTLIQFVD